MNTRLRLLMIVLGGMVVLATFTFNVWFPLVINQEDVILFPELPESLHEAFAALPQERQDDYLALRAVDTVMAARMAAAAVQPPRIVPDDQQIRPERSGQVELDSAEFVGLGVNRSAKGTVTVYELPDGSRYMWLEGFEVIAGDDLRFYFSAINEEGLEAILNSDDEPKEYRLTPDDYLLDPVRFEIGNQAYELPREADLSRYSSLIIYSRGFDLLWAYAEF